MTVEQILVIAVVALALALVIRSVLRVDIAALSIAVIFGLAQFAGLGILDIPGKPASAVKAISGFGQPVVITLLSLFILTRCLEKSGITRWIARYLLKLGGRSESRLIGLFAAATAFLSLFMNNLAAGALLLPSALEASRQTGIKPSKLLIPVAYGSLLGGAATYFTTANIIVSDLLAIAQPPQRTLHILDFTPTGGLIALAGIAFLALFGRRLLPDRAPALSHPALRPTGSELEDAYQLGERLWEGRILPGSVLAGKSLSQAAIGEKFGVTVPALYRGRQLLFPLEPDQTIQAGDCLVIVGREERVRPLAEQGVSIEKSAPSEHISPKGLALVELMPAPRSAVEGKSLRELSFRSQYGW
ncbi:MAG TPA: SLC13 family permease, partial [Anaerolineaceae bacterium]